MKILNFELAPLDVPLHRRRQTVMVLFYIFMFLHGLSFIGLYLVIHFLFTDYYWLSFAYVIWFYYDYDRCYKGSRPSKWLRGLKVWHWFRDYFPVNLIKTAELDPYNGNYLFCVNPHGILCFGIFANFATDSTGFSEKFPGITPHLLTLNTQFMPPLMREVLMLSGTCSASERSMKYILENKGQCKKKGQAAILILGGVAEMLESYPGRYKLVLKKRKGFARVALETGTSLVPVFNFGENDSFSALVVSDNSIVRKIQNMCKRAFSFALPIWYGRGIFNYNFGFMPYRKPINAVVGKPIPVDKVEKPTREQIDQLHDLYISELIKLFDEHKEKYLVDKSTVLEIV